jgi:hypothetical protein
MLVAAIELEGLRHGETVRLDELGSLVELPAGAPGIAILDALGLWAAALNTTSLMTILPTLGLNLATGEDVIIEERGLPTQVLIDDPEAVTPLLAPAETKKVVVSVDVDLDPPLFGKLRAHAARYPRLVAALGQHPSVRVKVGWLFNRDCSAASLTVHAVHIGDTDFPIHEAAPWLIELLRDLGSRFARLQTPRDEIAAGEWLASYGLSGSAERRERFEACAAQLQGPPFHIEQLGIISDGGTLFYPAFTKEVSRARQVGFQALAALSLVGELFLTRPDVLLVDSPVGAGPGLRPWLEEVLSSDRAPVEQVFWVGDCV